VYYNGAGWMNPGALSDTPWLVALKAMAGETYPDVVSVSAAAQVMAYRLQLDDIAMCGRSCAHVDNGVACGAPGNMGGECGAALCAVPGGLRKVA
jgi:hypothetical protein